MDVQGVEDLLREAGGKHHQAFLASDGVDPEWALWYAGYLQTRLWDGLGRLPTRSELVHQLIECDRSYRAAGSPGEWPRFYSRRFVEYFGT